MDHGRLDLLKHLGEGAFAKVQHARLRPEEGGEPTRDVAVKTLRQVGGWCSGVARPACHMLPLPILLCTMLAPKLGTPLACTPAPPRRHPP